ncbi:MAG TPA: peroxidase, partial [Methylomirabilota bacterium]|nr:peroxidase [Methylomirabilota bacterium]
KLSREEQELRVGRDKLNGCPIISIREEPGNGGAGVRYVPVPDDNCPQRPDHQDTAGHKDPGLPNHTLLAKSHMYRANPTRLGPGSHGSNRIFRQGYEFLEPLADGTPRVGLNFVSFQCDLERFTNILTTGGWMSSINFGGPDDREEDIPSIELAQVVAGGYYAVPPLPLGDDPFPGAVIFR